MIQQSAEELARQDRLIDRYLERVRKKRRAENLTATLWTMALVIATGLASFVFWGAIQ